MLTVDGSVFEGLFKRVLKPEGAFKAQLRLAGFDVDRLEPRYQEEVFGRALHIATEHAFADDDVPTAHRRIGHALIEGYFATILGRLTATMVPVLGVEGTLKRLPTIWQVPQPGMGIHAERLNPREWMVRFSDRVMTADLVAGILEAALGRADATVRAEVVERRIGAGVVRLRRGRN